MKKNNLILIIVCLVLAAALLATTACSSGNSSTTTTTATTTTTVTTTATSIQTATTSATAATPKYGGTLRFGTDLFAGNDLGWNGDPGGIDGISWPCLFYDTLIDQDVQGNISPRLLTGWQTAPDLKTLTLTLRQGVKFHDGSDWNAKVAKWNLDLMIQSKQSYWANVASVDVLDDYTVRLNVNKWTNSIFTVMGEAHMTSEAAFEAHGQQWMYTHPIGTGPFIMTSYVPGQSLIGVRNDNYWNGKPYLDSVELYYFSDQMSKESAFKAGEMDVVDGDLGKAEYELKQSGASVTPAFLAVMSLSPDSKNPKSPWANLQVRQAVDYAINKDEIVNTLGYGWWTAVDQWALPGASNYITDLQARTYNPDKAKQLLSAAGYPSFHTQLLGSTAITNKDVMVAIQGYLSKVGITADVNMIDNGTFWDMNSKGWDGALGNGMAGSYADPDATYYGFISQTSPMFATLQKPDELQALLDAASATPKFDPAASKKIPQYIFDNATIIPIFAVARGAVAQPYVHALNYGHYNMILYFDPQKTWLSK